MQPDVVLRLELTAVHGLNTFRHHGHHAAGLRQKWQRTSALRMQVQEVQLQVQLQMQLLQLNPIGSVMMIPASQPSMAAHPPNLCRTGQQRCASCPTNTCFACTVVLHGRRMPYCKALGSCSCYTCPACAQRTSRFSQCDGSALCTAINSCDKNCYACLGATLPCRIRMTKQVNHQMSCSYAKPKSCLR